MKRLYSIVGTMLLTALAANALPVETTAVKGPKAEVSGYKSLSSKFVKEAAAQKAPATRSAFNPIYDAPAGDTITMTGSSMSFYVYYGEVNMEEWSGLAYDAVQTPDGEFYLKNPISYIQSDTYIKGRVTEDGLAFDFPQPLVSQFNGVQVNEFYADILEPAEIEDPDYGWITTFIPAEETRTLNFYRNDDGSYTMDGEYMLGLTYDNVWEGFGEMGLTLTEFKAQAVTMPEGLKIDYSYILVDELNGYDGPICRPLAVAFDGDDVYINGLSMALPDAVAKGSLDREAGTLTIPSNQLLGRYLNYYLFLMTGDGTTYYDPYWEENMVEFDIMESDLVFNYDAEKKTFTPVTEEGHDGYLIINFGNLLAMPCEYYAVARIDNQGEITDYSPMKPEIISCNSISEYDPTYSYAVEFSIFGDNTQGQMLLDNYIYYNIYINGELYPLTVDEFPGIAEITEEDSITNVPASFSDGDDIYAQGTYHGIAFRNKDIDRIGIQSIYILDGEVVGRSEIAEVFTTGVENVEAEAVSSEYYDLNGRRVSGPAKGQILVKRTVNTDGSIRTSKVIVR